MRWKKDERGIVYSSPKVNLTLSIQIRANLRVWPPVDRIWNTQILCRKWQPITTTTSDLKAEVVLDSPPAAKIIPVQVFKPVDAVVAKSVCRATKRLQLQGELQVSRRFFCVHFPVNICQFASPWIGALLCLPLVLPLGAFPGVQT